MAWTTPKTWSTEPLTSFDMNTHIRDNLNALKTPPTGFADLTGNTNKSTTSTTFVDVDATNLSKTITTTGGYVLVTMHAFWTATTQPATVDLLRDGVSLTGGAGVLYMVAGYADYNSVMWWDQPAAGSRTYKLQWKVTSGGTAQLVTSTVGGQFMVREVT